MPQAVDLVAKNAAATDKTFSLLTPSSGNGSVAEWALKEGAVSSAFPRFTAAARPSYNKKAPSRVLQVKLRVPATFVDSVTGQTLTLSGFEFNGTATVPDNYPEALKADAVAYVTSLIATALVQSMMRDGYPAT